MLRVAELVRHSIAQMLARDEIVDPVLETHVVTVSRVTMSPDLKLATVYRDAARRQGRGGGGARASSGTRNSCAARSRITSI